MLIVTAGGWESHYSPRGINGPIDELLFPSSTVFCTTQASMFYRHLSSIAQAELTKTNLQTYALLSGSVLMISGQ